jgi:hypothetical protein
MIPSVPSLVSSHRTISGVEGALSVATPGQVTVDGSHAALNLGLRGVGLIYGAEPILRPHTESGALATVLEEWLAMGGGFPVYYSRPSPHARKIRAMWCPVLFGNGAPEEIRTPNLLIRSQMLYPIELRARIRCRAGRRLVCVLDGTQDQLAAKETALAAGAEPSGEDPLLQGVRRGRRAAPQSTRKSLNWVAFLPVPAAQRRGCAG